MSWKLWGWQRFQQLVGALVGGRAQMADPDILTTRDMLSQELDEIEHRRGFPPGAAGNPSAHDDHKSFEQRTDRLQLSALCLSGGGIRSAAFCLGVLQALADKHMLRHFDYLSTVSGGGFIGGWLQVLIRDLGGVDATEKQLAERKPAALSRLRAYTNYLTPQTGPFSADTWAGIVLYLRNLLINWAVFAPLFLLLTLVPIFYRTAISACCNVQWLNLLLLGCAGGALLYAVVRSCILLPSHRPPRSPTDPTPSYADARSIGLGIVYPALAWTLLVPWMLNFATSPTPTEALSDRPWLADHAHFVIPLTYLALMVLGYALSWLWLWQSHRTDPGIDLFKANFKANFGRWILASTGAAILTWFMLSVAVSILPLELSLPSADEQRVDGLMGLPLLLGSSAAPFFVDTATALTVFAPLGLVVVHVLQTALFVALRLETKLADLDREWLGRANAMILRLAVGWTVFALCCLVLPVMVSFVQQRAGGGAEWNGGSISVVGLATMLIGGLAAWLGKIWPSVEELVANPPVWDRIRAFLPAALGVLFAVSLLVVFGGVLHFSLADLQMRVSRILSVVLDDDPPNWLRLILPLILQFAVAAILLTGVMKFRHVNVNRFSMHAVYRNRLTRAFLGSPRSKREQDPFTGFDPDDNPPLTSLLWTADCLFPVINTTLNITAGTNTAWAERKAASFTTTPLACGAATLRHPKQPSIDADPAGAFVPTNRFAGLETLKDHPTCAAEHGPGLGNTLTVSGAAVSPSWGYHSSRVTAFIMTLFNVRLGIWLPNPSKATADDLRLARPRNSLTALINEMLGATTDVCQAIYLSDGGHFENLGLYEMFRRRCSLILVVDAGADAACSLFDLGNAIRKAEIDHGIAVKMQEPMRVYARTRLEAEKVLGSTALGFAVGCIDYGEGHTGRILYIKPSFLPLIPVDVRAYGAVHTAFPHESTLDQWFSESQFESYRMLGRHQMGDLLERNTANDHPDPRSRLGGLFEAAQLLVTREKQASSCMACDTRLARHDKLMSGQPEAANWSAGGSQWVPPLQ